MLSVEGVKVSGLEIVVDKVEELKWVVLDDPCLDRVSWGCSSIIAYSECLKVNTGSKGFRYPGMVCCFQVFRRWKDDFKGLDAR